MAVDNRNGIELEADVFCCLCEKKMMFTVAPNDMNIAYCWGCQVKEGNVSTRLKSIIVPVSVRKVTVGSDRIQIQTVLMYHVPPAVFLSLLRIIQWSYGQKIATSEIPPTHNLLKISLCKIRGPNVQFCPVRFSGITFGIQFVSWPQTDRIWSTGDKIRTSVLQVWKRKKIWMDPVRQSLNLDHSEDDEDWTMLIYDLISCHGSRS